MEISNRQREFLSFCDKERELPVDVNDRNQMIRLVVIYLFEIYITSKSESDRMESSWQLYSLTDEIKSKVKLWHLIEDKEEFKILIKNKMKNRERLSKNNQKRRHEKRDDFAMTDNEWEDALKHFNYNCAYCGNKRKMTFDHFHPFSKGGDFMKGNVIPCCKTCNSKKRDKIFEEWFPKQKFYNKDRENKVLTYVENNRQLALL